MSIQGSAEGRGRIRGAMSGGCSRGRRVGGVARGNTTAERH
jgi:hypothetical protein